MGMIVGGASIAVIKSRNGGMECEAYVNELDVVLSMMDNGSLGGGNQYGGDEHLAALDSIERHLSELRECIAEDSKDEESA